VTLLSTKSDTASMFPCRNWLIPLLLGVAAAASSFLLSSRLMPQVLNAGGDDVWFDADCVRVYGDMSSLQSENARSSRHPLFSLVTCLPNVAAQGVMRLTPELGVRVQLAVAAGLFIALMFLLLRQLDFHTFDALVFSLVASVSGAAWMFAGVPETHLFGGVSVLAGLLITARYVTQPAKEWAYALGGVLTLSITVTNYSLGLLFAFVGLPWRRALLVSWVAVTAVAFFWAIGTVRIPHSLFFLADLRGDIRYVRESSPDALNRAAWSVFGHSMVLPAIEQRDKPRDDGLGRKYYLTIQSSGPGSGSPLGFVAVILWLGLLTCGVGALVSGFGTRGPFYRVLALFLLGQVTLFLVYGPETFLLTLNVIPALVVLAAMGTRTRLRRLVLITACLFVVCAAVNNARQLADAEVQLREIANRNVASPQQER
jgi:hypothetical protein